MVAHGLNTIFQDVRILQQRKQQQPAKQRLPNRDEKKIIVARARGIPKNNNPKKRSPKQWEKLDCVYAITNRPQPSTHSQALRTHPSLQIL